MEKLKISGIVNSKIEDNYRIVILTSEHDSDLILPIMIEAKQAEQLEIAWRKLPHSRPYTADFISEALQGGGIQLEQIVIEKVENNTFFATAKFNQTGRTYLVEARPSDALVLAAQLDSSIYAPANLLKDQPGGSSVP